MTHGFGQRPQLVWSSVAKMLSALVAGPCTITDLVEETGLHESTLRGYIAELRRTDPKLVVIEDRLLAPNNQPSIHAYRWNPGGKDCKIKKTPPHIRSRNYRKRKREAARNAALGTDIRAPLIPHRPNWPNDCEEAGHAEGRCGNASCLPQPPAGYTAEELERDNPYNAWLQP